jgi:hypothetical protein
MFKVKTALVLTLTLISHPEGVRPCFDGGVSRGVFGNPNIAGRIPLGCG